MVGLFEYTYDYYEWEELIAVSECSVKLIKKFHEVKKGNEISCVLIDKLHEKMRDDETRHYMIKEVKLL